MCDGYDGALIEEDKDSILNSLPIVIYYNDEVANQSKDIRIPNWH